MDENEITTVADTQAENTADTADTGQTTPTTEELIQQLTARVAALEEIVGEDEYELRYSGEQTDELLDGGTAVFRAKTAAQIVSLVNRGSDRHQCEGCSAGSEGCHVIICKHESIENRAGGYWWM